MDPPWSHNGFPDFSVNDLNQKGVRLAQDFPVLRATPAYDFHLGPLALGCRFQHGRGSEESAPKQIGVQLIERGHSLRTGKNVRVIRLWVFQLCP
jgi:hypothetical protein